MNEKSKFVQNSQRRKKQFAVDMFGGKCQRCNYDKCINALEFHHIDKDEKEEIPSYIIMRWSWKRAVEELKKCILLCSNCHREIHYQPRDIEYEKSLLKDILNVECENCHDIFQTTRHDAKYCSPMCSHIANRKVIDKPNSKELKDLIESLPMTKIGKMYGVSDNTVRKWAKIYNILT